MNARRRKPGRTPKRGGRPGRGHAPQQQTATAIVPDGHGGELQVTIDLPTPQTRPAGPVAVLAWAAARHRRTLLPPAVAFACTYAAPLTPATPALITVSGAALTVLASQAGFRRPRWAAAWVAATTAAAAVHTAGWAGPWPFATTAALVAVTGGWWLGHRERSTITAFGVAERWDHGVGAAKKSLPGSRIIPGTLAPHPVGTEAVVQLVGGEQDATLAISRTERVASGLTEDVADVVLEPVTKPRPRADQVRLLIVQDNPLHSVSRWPGPGDPDRDRDYWRSRVGNYVDLAPATYPWFIDGSGPIHALIGGAARSGKSRFLDLLLATSRHRYAGLIVDWVGDPQWGQSLPDWQGNVDWFAAGPDACMDMLRAALQFAEWRNQQFASEQWTDTHGRERTGVKVATPTRQRPMLVVTLDEAAVILAGAEGVQLLEDLAKLAPKALVAVRLAQQAVLLDQMKSNTLRSQLIGGGSIWSFRTDAQNAQSGFAGWPINPSKIPAWWPNGDHTKGLGMTHSDGRQAMFRADLLEDPYDYATAGHTTRPEDAWLLAAPGTYLAARGVPRDPTVVQGEVITPPGPSSSQPGGTAQMTCREAILHVLRRRGGKAATADIGQDVLGLSGHAASTVASTLSAMKGTDVRQPDGPGTWHLI